MKTPWINVAKKEIGVHEIPGKKDNPEIVKYLETTDYPIPKNYRDEIPWCSAFVNWCLEQVDLEGTNSAWSQSWLPWGRGLELPQYGCIVVFKWSKTHGHVGFCVADEDDYISILGGNQSDSVCVKNFYYDNVIAYRMPKIISNLKSYRGVEDA